ncbi:hypothetical protein PS1_038156 [Malus domestica]
MAPLEKGLRGNHRTGIDTWKGKQLHSHSHLTPEPFRDQVVILLGSTPSAIDISRDIAGIAKEEMMEDVKAFYSSLEASGTPKYYTHNIYAYKVNSISLFPCLFCSLVSLPS